MLHMLKKLEEGLRASLLNTETRGPNVGPDTEWNFCRWNSNAWEENYAGWNDSRLDTIGKMSEFKDTAIEITQKWKTERKKTDKKWTKPELAMRQIQVT